MSRTEPVLADVQHIRLCYSQDRMCAHPRQCPIRYFGNGELIAVHHHAPSAYRTPDDIQHGQFGYKGRAKILLQRSFDHGQTWPREHDVVIWDDSLPLEAKRAALWQADDPDLPRDEIDLSSPDSLVYFARPATGPKGTDGRPVLECFAFRSGDRGHTWETVPTRITPPPGFNYVHVDGYPPVRFDDGTLMVAATLDNRNVGEIWNAGVPNKRNVMVPDSVVAVYGTDNNGLSWNFLAEVTADPTGYGTPVYENLLRLSSGRLQCYMLNIGGPRNAILMNYSDDGGYSWSDVRPLVVWGQSPWLAHRRPGQQWPGVHYRSPWPLRLRDGRIVVLFARRKSPSGIGIIVSEDDGATWSAEAVLRADASTWDLGYPHAVQLDDGRIFTSYYFTEDDGNNLGGTRHIAGSFFRL